MLSHSISRAGLILLLIWTPFAFGSVHAWAFGLLNLQVFALTFLLSLGGFFRCYSSRFEHKTFGGLEYPRASLVIVLFIGCVVFQLVPLKASVLSLISPSTASLYHMFLPGWPHVSAPLTVNPYATVTALSKLLAYAAVVILVVNSVRRVHHVRMLAGSIVGVGCALAIFGIVQDVSGTSAVYWVREAGYVENLFGPYLNGNHFAGYQEMAIPLAIGLLLSRNSMVKHQDKVETSRWTRVAQVALLVGLAIMIGALILTRSRGGFLGFVASLVFLGGGLFARRDRVSLHLPLVVAVAILVGLVLVIGGGPLLSRFIALVMDEEALPWAGRLAVWQATWQMLLDFPVFGIGLDAFGTLFPSYQGEAEVNLQYSHAHNDVLQLIVETGCVGFILLASGLVWFVVDIIRKWRLQSNPFCRLILLASFASLVALGVHSWVDFNLRIPANALLFSVLLGLTYACANLPGENQEYSSTRHKRIELTKWRRVGLVAWTCGLLGVVLWGGVAATRVAVAGSYFPQQEMWAPDHWTHQAELSVRQEYLNTARRWMPSNPWYAASQAELEIESASNLLKLPERTETDEQQVRVALRNSVALYEQARKLRPLEATFQFGWMFAVEMLSSHDASYAVPWKPVELSTRVEQVANLGPSHADIQFRAGYMLLSDASELIEPSLPLTYLRNAVRLDHRYDELVLKAYLRFRPEAEALREFARTLPNTWEGHLRIANLLTESHWEFARLHYRVAMAMNQTEPEVLEDYGRALQHQKAFKDAAEVWTRLIRLTPEQPQPYLQLALAERKLENYDNEVTSLQQLVERFPGKASYHVRLAQAYARAGSLKEAESAWQKVIELEPTSDQGVLQLARLYGRQGKDRKAFDTFKRLLKRRPDDPEVLYHLGFYSEKAGELSEAVRYFRQAVKLHSQNEGYRRALERVLQQQKS